MFYLHLKKIVKSHRNIQWLCIMIHSIFFIEYNLAIHELYSNYTL